MSLKRSKSVPELVKKYRDKYPDLQRAALRKLIRLENKIENPSEIRKLSRYLKQAFENEEKPRTSEIAIVDIVKPELPGMQPLNTISLPASGWIGVKIVNDGNTEYKGCLGKVKTNAGEFSLFDWEEYLRNSNTRRGAAPRSFILLEHETKRLYTKVVTNTLQLIVTLEIGKETIKKELLLPI